MLVRSGFNRQLVHGSLRLTVCGVCRILLMCIWSGVLLPVCTSPPASEPLCAFALLLFFLPQGDKSLIPGGLLGAMTSDASRSNNIQGVEFYNIPSLLVLKPLEHCSAHFHTYCLFCLLWMHLHQDPSRKESVFFKTYLTVVNTAEMPL